jgi:serine/threonine protein phosphatase PrpC
MSVHSATDVGRARDVNENSVGHETFGTIQLLAVADGMGGHSAGDVASETALNELTEAISDEVDTGQTDRQTILETGIRRANDAVRDARTGDPARGNMGTTLVAALIRSGDAVVGNVGDSRAYHVSTGEIEQISVDQSFVRNLIETGSITEAEARTHPQRHVLTQACTDA